MAGEVDRFFDLTKEMTYNGMLVSEAHLDAPVVLIDYAPELVLKVRLFYHESATAAEKTEVETFVAAWDWTPRKTRSLFSILGDINGLTNPQLSLVWNDLNSGNPPKLALDTGPNAASIWVMQFVAVDIGGLTALEKNEARQRVMSFYVQDNQDYLVHPPFDQSINIPGYEPA